MSNTLHPRPEPRQPMVKHIRLKGHPDCSWTDWFEGLTITPDDNGETLLTGSLVDQATLHGVLTKVRDRGLPVLAVTSVPPAQVEV